MDLGWAALNNRKVTLSFKPATDADQQALLSLLPEGEITDLSQLPSSIPSYLVEVIPELKVDGATIMQGAPVKLGEELNFAFSVTTLGEGTKHYQSPVVAGSYLSVAVAGGSVSPSRLDEVKTSLEATKGTLESQDQALIAGLSRETGGSALASRSNDKIRAVFDRHRGAIYALHNRALRKEPLLRGEVVLELVIEPSGGVSACRILSSELKSPALERKLVARVPLFRFESKQVVRTAISYPIEYLPS